MVHLFNIGYTGGKIGMNQRFIELGPGYSDLYELLELAKANHYRMHYFLCLQSEGKRGKVMSFVLVMKKSSYGDFIPLYICREGIPALDNKPSKRYELFEQAAREQGKDVISMEVRHSSTFADTDLYYQYLIGILRMNRFLPPLQ
jgi:hypothetical protein